MLQIDDLSFSYGAVKAIDHVSMTIPRAQVTCIMGRNGVGKTTLLKIGMGLCNCAAGRALVSDPKVLLRDEPTEGIQPNIIQQIGEVLKKLVAVKSMTILLVEQYLDFVREIATQFYIMDRGRIVAHGPTTDLSSEIVHRHLSV